MASPEVSARSPRWPASEIVSMASRTGERKDGRTERRNGGANARLTPHPERSEGWGVLPSLRPSRLPSFLHTSLGPERQLHHLRLQALAAAFDLEPGAGLGHVGREVGGADAEAERRAQGAAPDDVHFAAGAMHRVATAGEAAALELEADQAAGDAALLLHAQRLEAEEPRALVELHDPAEV